MFHVTVIGNNNEVFNVVVDADIIGETDAFDMSGNNNYVHDVVVFIPLRSHVQRLIKLTGNQWR
jgi:hypothetical protein